MDESSNLSVVAYVAEGQILRFVRPQTQPSNPADRSTKGKEARYQKHTRHGEKRADLSRDEQHAFADWKVRMMLGIQIVAKSKQPEDGNGEQR
jgi:hypothetical protein